MVEHSRSRTAALLVSALVLCLLAGDIRAEKVAFADGHRVMSFAELQSSVWMSERDCPSLCDAACDSVDPASELGAKNCANCLVQGVPCGTRMHVTQHREVTPPRFQQVTPIPPVAVATPQATAAAVVQQPQPKAAVPSVPTASTQPVQPTAAPAKAVPQQTQRPKQDGLSQQSSVKLALVQALQLKKVLKLQALLLQELAAERQAREERDEDDAGSYAPFPQQYMPMAYMYPPQPRQFRPYRRSRFTHRLHDALGTDETLQEGQGDSIQRLNQNLEQLLQFVQQRKAGQPAFGSKSSELEEIVSKAASMQSQSKSAAKDQTKIAFVEPTLV